MTALLDTNVLMDMLDARRDNHEKALGLIGAVNSKNVKLVLTTQSIVDAAYMVTGPGKVPVAYFRTAIGRLMTVISISDVTPGDVGYATKSDIPDYEDAIQISCAERSGCDVIVSGDKKLKDYTDIPVLTVREMFSAIFVD